MAITVAAVYEDGVLKPESPLNLKERSKVTVAIETRLPTADDGQAAWEAIDALRGLVKGAPPDVSAHHDKCLYGDHGK